MTVSHFLEAMVAAGIRPLEPIADKLSFGEPVRFRADGDKPGRRNGWACLHLDGVPAGVFRHYRLGIRIIWRSGVDPRLLSPAEWRAISDNARERDVRHKAETAERQGAASTRARAMTSISNAADPAHGYLRRKRLPPFGIRQLGSALLVPMVDADHRLWNVQQIYPDGRKMFLLGGRTEGLFWPHGAHLHDGRPSAGPLVIGEGYATMAAIHVATNYGIVATMSARNLETVARTIRQMFPAREIIIAADDDSHLPENLGLRVARKAAEAIGAHVATPRPQTRCGGRGVDFADMCCDEVSLRIAAARLGK